MDHDYTEVSETSETTFVNDVESITFTNPCELCTSDNNNSNGITKTTSVKDHIGISDSAGKADSKGNSTSCMTISMHICNNALWLLTILLVVGVMLIPMIIYLTRPPTVIVDIPGSDIFDEETCLADLIKLSGNLSTIQCQISELNISSEMFDDCVDNSSLTGLNIVYNQAELLRRTQCMESVQSFYCSVANASCSDNNNDVTASSSNYRQCVEVRDLSCSAEWRITINVFNVSLPDCGMFADYNNPSTIPELICPDHYGTFCDSLCLPQCSQVSRFDDRFTSALKVCTISFFTFAIMGGVVSLIACFLTRKKMFKYPQVFVVYGTISVEFFEFSYVLPFIFESSRLQCPTENYIQIIQHPTRFCQLQGFFIQAGFTTFLLFWSSHVLHIFISLAFPIKYHKFSKKKSHGKIVYVVEIILILTLGVLPSIIIAATSGYQFAGFPPICITRSPNVLFYTAVFPVSLITIFGVCLLLGALWALHKKHKNESDKNSKKVSGIRFTLPQFKLLVLVAYYWLTAMLLLSTIALMLRNSDHSNSKQIDHFLCSIGGYRMECDVFRDQLLEVQTETVVMDILSIIVLSFVNVVNLFFVINFSDFKKYLKKKVLFLSNHV